MIEIRSVHARISSFCSNHCTRPFSSSSSDEDELEAVALVSDSGFNPDMTKSPRVLRFFSACMVSSSEHTMLNQKTNERGEPFAFYACRQWQ